MRYLVLDLETTGLDPAKDQILEVGAIAVDVELRPLARFEAHVYFASERVASVTPFVREMHTKNGLWALLGSLGAAHSLPGVDLALSRWLEAFGATPRSVVLAGHSIHFDAGFIRAQFPETAALLSHRLMDFGALNRFLQECGLPVASTPEMPHRAMADCEIELAEARAMRERLTAVRS